MAEEAVQIEAKALRGYDERNSDGLWVEWSDSEGAWYVRITLYVGSVGEGNVAARQTFYLTNEIDDFVIHEHTFTEAVAGTTYIVGVKYYPEAESEAWTESDETYTTVTYTPTVVDPPLDASVFKIRDRDDVGNELLYIGTTTASFVANLNVRSYTKLVLSWKKSTAQAWEYDSIEFDPADYPVSETGYEWDYLDSGYFQGWFQLDLSGLDPGTTYLWEAIGYYEQTATAAFDGSFTTLAATQLSTPTINGFPRATDNYKYSTLQIRLESTVANATSYEYQISRDSAFTSPITRESSTVISGYPLSGYFTGLTEGSRYYCRARALSSDAAYTTSNWSTVTSATVTTRLDAPTVTVLNRTTSSATLTLSAIANASSYSIAYRVYGVNEWTSVTGITGTSTSLTGLVENTTYEYQAFAVGDGEAFTDSTSTSGTFTTLATLATPTGLQASNITINSATLSWGAVSNASGYKVEYRPNNASNWSSVNIEN